MANEAPALDFPSADKQTVPSSALFSAEDLAISAPTQVSVTPVKDVPLPASPAPAPAAATPPADPAAPAPATPPADPAKPVVPVTAPADPAAPAPAAATPPADPAKPAVPEAKIKVGDKEYTRQELEAALAKRAEAPAPATPPTAEPTTPTPPAPTPEQVAQAESDWQTNFIKQEKLNVPVTEKEMEAILAGDKAGIESFQGKLNHAIAKAVMLARKWVHGDFHPIINQLQSQLAPVVASSQEVEAAAAEQQFVGAYPEFKSHMATVRSVGEALLQRYPAECAKMTREALLAEVAAQSDRIIQADCSRFAPGKNWRELLPTATPAPAPVVPAPAPIISRTPATTGTPAAPAAPAAPAPAPATAAAATPPRVQPPAGNSPAGTGVAAQTKKDWHKETALSLQG